MLEVPTEGEILIEGESITAPKTNVNKIREKMGMVFQQFNLFPHLTVLDNITLAPIKVKKMPKAEAEKLARELLNKVGLADKEDSYPAQLSGGQQQRICNSTCTCNAAGYNVGSMNLHRHLTLKWSVKFFLL